MKIVLVNLLTFFVLALCVEGLCFLGLTYPERIPGFMLPLFREYYRYQDRSIIQVTDCGQYDSALFYTLKPGSCSFHNREFDEVYHINSLGVRDDESSLHHPSIIFIGDSYTMGWGVKQDESFPQAIEKMTNEKVLNAGVSSYGSAREFMLLQRVSLDSVKYLFVQYHANDSAENESFLKDNFSLSVQTKKTYDSLRRAIDEREKYYLFKHIYGLSKSVARKLLAPERQMSFKASEAQDFLRVIKHFQIKPEIRIVVFRLDEQIDTKDKFSNCVDSLLKTNEFRSLSLETIKFGQELGQEDYYVLDEHLNAHGHRKIARKIHQQFFND